MLKDLVDICRENMPADTPIYLSNRPYNLAVLDVPALTIEIQNEIIIIKS
jgi:hypothetical protein